MSKQYVDGKYSFDAKKLWLYILNPYKLMDVIGTTEKNGTKDDLLYQPYLMHKKALTKEKFSNYRLETNLAICKEILSNISAILFTDNKPEDIVHLTYNKSWNRITFYTANGDQYESEIGLSYGTFMLTINKSTLDRWREKSVSFKKDRVQHLMDICNENNNKENKMNLAKECLNYFNLYLDTGDLELKQATEDAIKNGVDPLDGLKGFQIGSTFISVDEFKQ